MGHETISELAHVSFNDGQKNFTHECMNSYTITNYTKRKAKQFGVTVRLSNAKGKKIDVLKNGVKLASVGAAGMNDYPTYMRTRGNRYARQRRKLYRIRHRKDRTKRGTRGWWADKLLW